MKLFDNLIFVWSFRISILVLLISIVIAIIYLTPFPDLDAEPVSCDRKCHELDWPMICRIQLTLESRILLPKNCQNCSLSRDVCVQNGCFDINHFSRPHIHMANRQIPGPSIQVCVNDIMIIDVINKIPSQSVSIHWRGQRQRGSPMMDGVSMVTQCPIASYTAFQYKFRATDPGTHMWHLHTSDGEGDNLYGLFIVRESIRKDAYKPLYDLDYSSYHAILRETKLDANLLINGQITNIKKGIGVQYIVEQEKRYRFRVAHAGGGSNCPIECSIDGHSILVITLDGNSITPVHTQMFTIAPGERLDFILNANHNIGKYIMRFRTTCNPSNKAEAAIVYNSTVKFQSVTDSMRNIDDRIQTSKKVTTVYEDDCGKDIICINQLRSLHPFPEYLATEEVDRVIYLPYHYSFIRQGYSSQGDILVPCISNISFIYPSSPLISQVDNLSDDSLCNENMKPSKCYLRAHNEENPVCHCVHVIRINKGSSVELILSHHGEPNERDHIFHLHGHKFYIVSRTRFDHYISPHEIRRLDSKDLLLTRNFANPVLKDTISIPSRGVAALRFKASNPGYWILQESMNSKGTHGMEVILQVGEQHDLPELPENFPRCGNFIGPKFFLA